ncbi:hypothetical protein T11_3070 [Trichinella zimbabwensis]|uniref:Uncharacterized protein n=1 Tax=Trichinella zimbabwensis TaxID=268475 RepID=A0A0V1GP07_9BILA|nr:hypothetical protein T11_3070 [Trichinella zimbabwensis]
MQIVGEFLGIKQHVAEICVQSCLRESRPRSDKIQVVWILWKGNGTGQKKASNVVLVKSALCRKNRRGVGGGKTALGKAKCRGVFEEKTARGGKMRAKLFGESHHRTDKIQLVWILWR